jgi:hypothetical protein
MLKLTWLIIVTQPDFGMAKYSLGALRKHIRSLVPLQARQVHEMFLTEVRLKVAWSSPCLSGCHPKLLNLEGLDGAFHRYRAVGGRWLLLTIRLFVVSRPVLRHRMIGPVRNQSRRGEDRRAET